MSDSEPVPTLAAPDTTTAAPPSPPLPPVETLLAGPEVDRDMLLRLIRDSALGARQQAAMVAAVEAAEDPAAQARLLDQLRAALGY